MFRSRLHGLSVAFFVAVPFALTLSLCSPSVHATEAWSLLGLESDSALSRVDRLAIAEDLTRRLEILRRRVPMQQPDDAEAVRRQLTNLDDMTLASERRGRFFLSLPYQHYQLLELLDGAKQELDCVLTMEIPEVEHACWARLATIYLSEERLELGVGTLRAARLLPKDDDMPRPAQDPRVWYDEFGRGIVRRILTPWIQAQGVAAMAAAAHPVAPALPSPTGMDDTDTNITSGPTSGNTAEEPSPNSNDSEGESP
jgi:hypothetical protein